MPGDGAVYATFIEGELKSELDRRTSFDARGIAIVSTSGGLITLLAGAGALAGTGNTLALPTYAKIALIVALSLFMLAAAVGLIVNVPAIYPRVRVIRPVSMETMRKEKWNHSDSEARSVVANIHIATIGSLRKGNSKKAVLLAVGLGLQLVALAAVSVVVYAIVLRS